MNPLVRQFINNKINTITPEDLINLGNIYQIRLSRNQAIKIVKILRREKINIENRAQLDRILRQIGTEVGVDVQYKIQSILNLLLK